MNELLKMLDNQIEDEAKGVEEYQKLIEIIKTSDVNEEGKSLSVAILNKIKTDEAGHKQMLQILKEVITVR